MTVPTPVSMPANHQHLRSGNSAYLEKQRRIADRLAKLRLEYEDSQLLPAVACHLDDAERSRTKLDRTRAANTAERLLRSIPRKQPKRPRNAAEWYENDE
jgi:hypothetical protein